MQPNNHQTIIYDENRKGKKARIASDVRKATRERAEAEHAETMALKRELYKEMRVNRRANKEKLADLCFKLVIVFITSSVVACITLFIKDTNQTINWIPVVIGSFFAVFFLLLGIYILKI